ncbi:MAG: L-ectoine synthase [Pseudohongiella sp.]|nr:MAG: L-ectoine synthase [Pseudohongiella sp.]
MIVRNLTEIQKTPRRVVTENWESTRLLLNSDNMGFSFHITTIYAGTVNEMWYKNHLESVFCLLGRGKLVDTVTEREYEIKPGVIYALDKHDKHVLTAFEDLTLACVFNPPVNGRETHDADGSYILNDEAIGS